MMCCTYLIHLHTFKVTKTDLSFLLLLKLAQDLSFLMFAFYDISSSKLGVEIQE